MTDQRPRAATIEDVAQAAGVSRAAVSKVLRNAYGVSDAMRERVTAAMTELNYRPRIAARAMRGRTYTIGIELPGLSNQFFTRIVQGASAALEGTPYQLIIAPAEAGSRRGYRALEALVDRQVDGVIAVSPRVDETALERIAASVPVVMFGRHDTSDRYDVVAGDDAAGARAAMRHLLELGHTRIAHLTLGESREDDPFPHGVRLREYSRAMAAAGRAEAAEVWRTDEGDAHAYDVVRRRLAEGTDVTAVFAAHDELAFGALRAVLEAGGPLAVVGYDDVPLASHPAFGLTTVHQPGEAMGARAVEMLLERFAGRAEAAHQIFDAELIVRASARPPA
ncbi:LacI family DNA-binding transcriptional regulator [Microbacterium cremeum]|uniref:LacI family DNA-binding transcriptional regulator n=1 Tax=Microbacterium cremeum TaxID=2782169 RepID=UPI001887EB9F|nr:LacI family DNA-binding transcriptional regulator [Microbacterium cremeum]